MFKGNEKEVINIYRSIYNQGVEPKLFLNDFLEILYYIKNISSIKLDGNFFSLNDEEFIEIELISKEISPKTLLLFWQFTIKTLRELDIVSNQNLSMEMFLIRLLYLKEERIVGGQDKVDFNNEKYSNNNIGKTEQFNLNKDEDGLEIKNKTISQIKKFFSGRKF